MNKVVPDITLEISPLSSFKVTNQPPEDQPKRTTKKKILIFGVPILIIASVTTIICLVILKDKLNQKAHVDEYQETQYTLDVNTTIQSKVGKEYTSSHSQMQITIFALDMEGDIYRLMIADGAFSNQGDNFTLNSAPSDIFMSFKGTKNGEILQTNYNKSFISNENANFLAGIIQAFVVDQDSEFEVNSKCKKSQKGSTQCTANNKINEGKSTLFKKQSQKDSKAEISQEKYKFTSKTWINNGKIQKSSIEGVFLKKFNLDISEIELEFNMKADIKVVSSSKLNKDQLTVLNRICNQLPETELDNKMKKKETINKIIESKKKEFDSNLPSSLFDNSLLGRQLVEDDEHRRKLFDTIVTDFFFSLFQVPFNLTTRMLSGYDKYYRYWFCPYHAFKFGKIELTATNGYPCISSHQVLTSPMVYVPSFAQNASFQAYLSTFNLGGLTINMSAFVRVESTPYIQSYFNVYGDTVTKFLIMNKITVIVAGNATDGKAKVGANISCLVKSNITDYMVGSYFPFSAHMYIDKSIQGNVSVSFQFVTNTRKCYDFLGTPFCVKEMKSTDALVLYSQPLTYQYFPEYRVFYSRF